MTRQATEFLHTEWDGLAGVVDNKDHVAKIDDTHISIEAGSAYLRRSDGTLGLYSWTATASQEILIGPTGLYWITYKLNAQEDGVEFELLQFFPTAFENLETRAFIGRLWNIAGPTLVVSGRHMMLANDPYVSRALVWRHPTTNISVSCKASVLNTNYIETVAGQMDRWPITEIVTAHHTFPYAGDPQVNYYWGHLQGQTERDDIQDLATGDHLDVKLIANYWDNAGTPTLVPVNNFSAHRVYIYPVSGVMVWVRGQYTYSTMEDALNALSSETFSIAQWLADRQAAHVAWVIMRRGAINYSNSNDVRFVTKNGN